MNTPLSTYAAGLFDTVHFIDAKDLLYHLFDHRKKINTPIISLTSIVTGGVVDYEIFISRYESLKKNNGCLSYVYDDLYSRCNRHGSYEEQIQQVSNIFEGGDITIIDDVIFSGNTIFKIITDLSKNNINVRNLITLVISEKAYVFLSNLGINVLYGKKYDNPTF